MAKGKDKKQKLENTAATSEPGLVSEEQKVEQVQATEEEVVKTDEQKEEPLSSSSKPVVRKKSSAKQIKVKEGGENEPSSSKSQLKKKSSKKKINELDEKEQEDKPKSSQEGEGTPSSPSQGLVKKKSSKSAGAESKEEVKQPSPESKEDIDIDDSEPDLKKSPSKKEKKKVSTSEVNVTKKKGKKSKKKGKESKKDSLPVQEEEDDEKAVMEPVHRLPSSLKTSASEKKLDRTVSISAAIQEESEIEIQKAPSEKKQKKASSELSVEKKKRKKGTSEGSVTGKKKKKGKKTKSDDVQSELEEDNIKHVVSISEEAIVHKGKKAKKKKKSKKLGSRASSGLLQLLQSKQSLPTAASASEVSLKKKTQKSKSSMSLKKGQKSKSGTSIGREKTYSAAAVVEALRARSRSQRFSEWTLVEDDDSEEDSDYSYEDIIDEDYTKSATSLRPKRMKRKKKGKEEKGKKKKKKAKEKTAEVSEEEGEPKEKKPKKGKKGKKGKKKKKVEEVTEEEEEVSIAPQDDILAEIARMKYLAELEASGEETEAETTETVVSKKKKKKKGPKKKLSKKEKARLAAELAEKAKLNAEEEAAKAAELERIRLEEERRAAIAKEKRETFEQQIRMEQLEGGLEYFNQLVSYNKKLRADAKIQEDWEFYVDCGRLPNPGKCDQMNTFLHLWENMIDHTTMEEAAKRTSDMLELLNELDDLIDTTETSDQSVIDNWQWVRLLFRQQQAKSLDVATYRLLRDIEANLHRIDIPTADFKYQDENIALCMWLRIQLPTPLPNPRRPPKPRIEVNFSEMKIEAQFPASMDGEKMAIRALYVKYDHLSDLCDTYEKPQIPERYDTDLYNCMKLEWREKLLYKYNNRVRKEPPPPKEGEEEGETPEQPPEDVIGPEDDVPIVPYRKLEPTASEHVITLEDGLYSETRANLMKIVPDDVINLRKYTIIGGVYSLNLLKQPPQPQDFVTLELNLTPLYLPKQLEYVDLYLDFNPPAPPPPGVRRAPEEIEEDMKKQEEELDKLIFVTLTWPDHVIFLELPMVCFWDVEKSHWSKSEVHDLKHNEEKGQLTFRTRKGGTFALAVYRYANLPYQAWEIRPEANGTVTVQITAAILMVEFNVKDGLIAMSQLQNSPNNALQDIVGVYFPLPKLIRMLQNSGIDVFPAFDAFCYIENTCEKHWPMEKHLYFHMALLSINFNFAWSRWNVSAGRRGIVLQMREFNVERAKQKNHLMLHVTPLSAIYVNCTEVSQTFTEEGIENMKFYSDLYHLMKGTTSMAIKNKIKKVSRELVFALYELLVATRVASFS